MSLNIKELKIIALNVNSIIRHTRRANLKEFIGKTNPDILLLNETKLNKNYKVAFDGYNMARNDRPADQRGGGTATLIKKAFQIPNLLLEATVIKIKCGPQKFCSLLAYMPPIAQTHQF